MASGVSQEFSWAAKGWEAMSFLVCFLYVSAAALKIVSKGVEEGAEGGDWDMVLVEGGRHGADRL